MKVLLVDLGTPRDEISEPLGIETLAPYITDNVPEAQIYLKSLELDNYSDIGPILKNSHYEIIGLSTKIRAYEKFKTSVEKTQEESPDTILVAGDILGTYAFEDVLKLYNNIICVRGEGETAFSELVKEVAQNKKRENLKLTNIPNLAYISNNELVLTERESFDIRNAKHPLRSLAYKVFDQNGCSRIEGSRGCAYSLCSYCGTVEKYNGPGWKPFDITFVLEELSSLSNIGFKSPWFTDEDFFGDNPKRVEEFAKVLIEYKKDGIINPNLDFYINARVDSVLGVDFGGKKVKKF